MSFQQIKGQDQAIRIIKGYIQHAHLEGGYLFTGPEGVGKKQVAIALAKQLNCLEENPDTCQRCSSCLKIEKNQHPDVQVIDSPEPEIRIEAIRQMQKDINLKAYEGKFKVYIINNAHRLNPESSNALLKVLEEPPGTSIIILVTDKPLLLFKTIISRCKIIKFAALKREELADIFKKDYQLDNQLAHFLAYFSEGRLGRALSLKDTDIISEKNRIIDQLVLSSKADFNGLALQDKEAVRKYLNILVTWFRDIYLVKAGIAHSQIINSDRKDQILKSMPRFSFLDLNEILGTIAHSLLYLEQNINVRLLLYNLTEQIHYGAG